MKSVMQAVTRPSGMSPAPPTGSIPLLGAASICPKPVDLAQAHADALVSLCPFDVECVGAGDPNVDVVAFLETHELKDLGRQPNGELIVPLFDFDRTLLDCTHVHLYGADSSVNAVLQGA